MRTPWCLTIFLMSYINSQINGKFILASVSDAGQEGDSVDGDDYADYKLCGPGGRWLQTTLQLTTGQEADLDCGPVGHHACISDVKMTDCTSQAMTV